MTVVSYSASAMRDLIEAMRYYEGAGGAELSDSFANEVDRALERIATFPKSGSPKASRSFQIAGLRATYLRRFRTWVIYYIAERSEAQDQTEIFLVRVLDNRQSIQREWLDASVQGEGD